MSDHWHTITEWAQHASAFRKPKAHRVSADGTRQLLDCEAIFIDQAG